MFCLSAKYETLRSKSKE